MRSSRLVFLAASGVVAVSSCGSSGGSLSSEGSASTISASIPEAEGRSPEPESESTDVSDEPVGSDAPDSVPDTTQPAPDGDGDGDLPFGLRRCSAEFFVILADPGVYRDEPVYLGYDQPRDEVGAWAVQQPGFEDMWVDPNNNNWLSVGFTSDVDQRQADLETEFPGAGVVAVEIEYGREELDALRDEVFAVMTANEIDLQGGASVPSGRVNVFVGGLDEASLEPFAEFAGDPVCFEATGAAEGN